MISLLIINPNTTVSMTDGLKPLVYSLGFTNVCFISYIVIELT